MAVILTNLCARFTHSRFLTSPFPLTLSLSVLLVLYKGSWMYMFVLWLLWEIYLHISLCVSRSLSLSLPARCVRVCVWVIKEWEKKEWIYCVNFYALHPLTSHHTTPACMQVKAAPIQSVRVRENHNETHEERKTDSHMMSVCVCVFLFFISFLFCWWNHMIIGVKVI